MKNRFHLGLLFLILLSKALREMPIEGLASSSESLRLASARPLSGSANKAGSESKMWSANVALCGSGNSSASFSSEMRAFMREAWRIFREIRFLFCPTSCFSDPPQLARPVWGMIPARRERDLCNTTTEVWCCRGIATPGTGYGLCPFDFAQADDQNRLAGSTGSTYAGFQVIGIYGAHFCFRVRTSSSSM